MTVLLSQKHFGKLFPPEETGNLVPRAFPREEGGERGHCLPVAESLTCRVRRLGKKEKFVTIVFSVS